MTTCLKWISQYVFFHILLCIRFGSRLPSMNIETKNAFLHISDYLADLVSLHLLE